KFNKVKEPVVIVRDPNGVNLKFLEKFVGGLKRAMSIFIMATLVFLTLPASIFLIISFVLCLYLLSVNSIFFGVILGIIGLLIVCFEALELAYVLLTEKQAPAKRWAIMFLIALVISSVGAGLSLIKLKDIKFLNYEDRKDVSSTNVDYHDDLVITAAIDETIYFVVDENIKNVKVDVEYYKDFVGVSLVDRGSAKYVEFDYKNYSSYNEINKILDGLRNNVFYDGYYDHSTSITVTSNRKNIKQLINNLSNRTLVYVRSIGNGYAVDIDDEKDGKEMCQIDKEGINRCYRVTDTAKEICNVKFDSNGKVSAHNKECSCSFYRNEYHCYGEAFRE
ncbi:MAG: hypothetical protein K2L98_04150, partial [Bacilli bacterium]|nr:hypothetical protein [Bacilli bacterium]